MFSLNDNCRYRHRFLKSLYFFLLFSFLFLYPPTCSATAIIIDENGNSFSCTYNKKVGKDRPVFYKSPGGIPSGNAYIQKGACLPVYVPTAIRSEFYRPWDTVIFKLAEDLTVNGVIIAPAGSSVFGKVTNAVEPELWNTVGEIRLKMDSLYTYRNVRVPLNCIIRRKDDMLDRRFVDSAGLDIFGTNVRIPKDEILLVEVEDDTDLGITLTQLERFGVYYGIAPEDRMYEAALTHLMNRPY